MYAQSAEINEFADGPDEKEIARLVQKLNSLEEGERTVAKLTECGRQAIGPLKRFLFEGKPSVVYQPRRRAVEALAGIGAKETLIQFLKLEKDIADPAVRLSEEVVENSAAKALSAWRTNEVYEALLNCALPRPRIGLIEALGAFGRVEAISYFIEALEDDTSRSAGLEALRQLGPSTAVTLLAAALTRTPLEGEESTGSIKRRISALEILSDLGPPVAFWPLLRPLITESTSDIVIAVCKIAAEIGSIDDRRAAMSRLLSVLPSTDWFAQGKAENCLVLLYKAGEDIIDGEIARRNASPAEQRATDRVLRTLLRVRHRTREASAA